MRDCSIPWRGDRTPRSPWQAGARTAHRTQGSPRKPGRGSTGPRSSGGGGRGGGGGREEEPGPRIDRLAFIEGRDQGGGRGTKDGDGLFAGVDTLFPGKARYAGLIDSARAQLNPTRPDAIAPLLARALRELGAADSGQQAILEEALAAAAGGVINGVADDGSA